MKRRHSLPAEVYAFVEQTPETVLLECSKFSDRQKADSQREDVAPWTRLFTAPLRVCSAYRAAEIAGLFEEIESAVASGLSVAGFFAYECGACFEPAAGMHELPAGQPLAWFGIYERGWCFDHTTGQFVDGMPEALSAFRGIVDEEREPASDVQIRAEFALAEPEYAERIAAIHEWIRSGDVYQLNFTGECDVLFRTAKPESEATLASELYTKLRLRQPVEYGAFVHWQQGRRILSFSPELFFRVIGEGEARRITTMPMKGTAQRGRTTREDRERAEWLANDAKNRSENLMIVDLVRNDLGRLAHFGSVEVRDLFAVERYPALWQMKSTIEADLRPDVAYHDIFRALFPCGSVTGAPKVRAMQLISKIENGARGVYTGAIGFFSPRRTEFNVAIRTLELEGMRGTMGVGSGIVIDSGAAEEYRECLLKAEFLSGARSHFADGIEPPDTIWLIETMLWDDGYPLLELHLDRLTDSAYYFDFPCDREAIKTALLNHAREFTKSDRRKVRLLMEPNGKLHVGSEALIVSDAAKPGRVRMARRQTDSRDRWLYHKTTERAVYTLEWRAAQEQRYDDVLFLNERGEVTEGAIGNIFIEKNGRLFTPPIACGLLAGVYRRHLLETRPEIEERVLVLDDLRTADAVYLTNAVRGLRRVTIDWI